MYSMLITVKYFKHFLFLILIIVANKVPIKISY